MSLALATSWLKKNAVTILLIVAAVLVLVVVILGFWIKVKNFKVLDLFRKLQIANAKNEVAHLQTKKKVLETKEEIKEEEIAAIEAEIKEEEKKVATKRAEIEGLTNAEVAKRLTDLGF